MALMGGLLLQAPSTVTLLGAVLFLLVLYLFSGSSSEEQGRSLQDPGRCPCLLSKKYGSIFTVHFGPKKVVVLAGYKTVKQALVNQAEDFGDRDITPESGNMDSFYHDNNLVFSVGNLFGAGTDTTGTTLRWGLLLMAKYPHIQYRVREEISRVIGSRQPLAEDRKNLPYTDAVIHETQRLANISHMAIPHNTSRDVTFQGYFIKGTSDSSTDVGPTRQ
ncbi:cytochrome P450 2K1-like [Oncorhynchus tshawytscha]|uniref:cytochrome P450 2K1-like n=1 Tax=Oncorhynchus tshawytscha TaxID=74940 RepID=UPI001C3DE4BB|nr:cytochrome P450 2K1-like [Oncorhynchus tshawytscha]